MVAVTKYVDVEIIRMLIALGCRDLGESRPQALWEKVNQLQETRGSELDPHDVNPIRWHMIGHLQRNKVPRTIDCVTMIHSVDSLRLAKEIELAGSSIGRRIAVLLEINISGDASKHGFSYHQFAEKCQQICDLPHLDVRGMMAMASREGGLDRARSDFAAMRQLRDSLVARGSLPVPMTELSMGMSDDFEVAIEQGATIVRIGSCLYDGILE